MDGWMDRHNRERSVSESQFSRLSIIVGRGFAAMHLCRKYVSHVCGFEHLRVALDPKSHDASGARHACNSLRTFSDAQHSAQTTKPAKPREAGMKHNHLLII